MAYTATVFRPGASSHRHRNNSTNSVRHYTREAFERYRADAVTVNPYLGGDSLQPFFDYRNRGVIMRCKTSNPGPEDFQPLMDDGQPLYEKVAVTTANQWHQHNNCLLVVGGICPQQLTNLRYEPPSISFVVPSLGKQGANINELVIGGPRRRR